MNQTLSTDPMPSDSEDGLDRLLSGFFKSELQQPWPAAPQTTATVPSELGAIRNTTTAEPRNVPASSRRDSSRQSRYTLAASVALLLGTCWYLSDGYQGLSHTAPIIPAGDKGMLGGAGANDPAVLKQLQRDKAINDPVTDGKPKIKLP